VAVKRKYTMYHSAVLDADPDAVWAEIRDGVNLVKVLFGDAVENVQWAEDGAAERVPSRYEFTVVPSNDLIQQEIVGRNEVQRTLTYRIVGQALGIHDYTGNYRILPVTTDPDVSFLEWSREFMVAEAVPAEMADQVLAMMDNQINALRAYFAKDGQ
jgi:hypothetical protein